MTANLAHETSDDIVLVRPAWMTDTQWADVVTQSNDYHRKAIAASGALVLPHADWCVNFEVEDECNGLLCMGGGENRVCRASGMHTRIDEAGAPMHSEIHLHAERVMGPVARHDELTPADTHIVAINVEKEGWTEDNWVGLTVAQARALRDGLDAVIATIDTDAAELRTDFGDVLDYLGFSGVTA